MLPSALATASRVPASVLLEELITLEQNLIAGIALPYEIDAYVALQLELATRNRLEVVFDPRD